MELKWLERNLESAKPAIFTLQVPQKHCSLKEPTDKIVACLLQLNDSRVKKQLAIFSYILNLVFFRLLSDDLSCTRKKITGIKNILHDISHDISHAIDHLVQCLCLSPLHET